MYLKKAYNDDPIFANSKVVYSVYDNGFEGSLNENYATKAQFEGAVADDLTAVADPSFNNINQLGVDVALTGKETRGDVSINVRRGFSKVGAEWIY